MVNEQDDDDRPTGLGVGTMTMVGLTIKAATRTAAAVATRNKTPLCTPRIHGRNKLVVTRQSGFTTTTTSSSSSSSFVGTNAAKGGQQQGDGVRFRDGVLGGLVITVLGGMRYLHDKLDGTEGVRRAGSFYTLAIPSYLEYRYHMWRDSPEETWDELDRRTSQKALDKILELKGRLLLGVS